MRERRRYPRVLQPFDAQYRAQGELMAGWRTVRILNLGAGGVRFTTEDLLERGMLIELQVALPILREPLALMGRVVWSQALASGVTENGVAFEQVTPQQGEQIDALVRFLVKPSSASSS